jgi:hypothetical protein
MANKYRPLSVVGKATYGDDEFEADLSPAEEKDALGSKHLELVPRTYKVLSDNYTAAAQGETFEATYLVENEAALIQGGHIERVDPEPELVDDPPSDPPGDPSDDGPVVGASKKKKED